MTAALYVVPRRYLKSPPNRTMIQAMPNNICLENTPEAKKALRIASLLYSANVLDKGGLEHAAKYLRIQSAVLKHGVPDGCQSFSDDDEPSIDIQTETANEKPDVE